MENQKVSNTGIDLIKHFESLHDGDLTTIGLEPKMCPAGIWTEGYGHAMIVNGHFLRGEQEKERALLCSQIKNEQDAIKMLEFDLTNTANEVNERLKVRLSQSKFDALISHYYNCGYSQSIFSMINKGMVEDIYLRDFWLSHYIKANGVKLKGLVRRRAVEWHLFATGKLDFEAWKLYEQKPI